jgi:hypothetical protein
VKLSAGKEGRKKRQYYGGVRKRNSLPSIIQGQPVSVQRNVGERGEGEREGERIRANETPMRNPQFDGNRSATNIPGTLYSFWEEDGASQR